MQFPAFFPDANTWQWHIYYDLKPLPTKYFVNTHGATFSHSAQLPVPLLGLDLFHRHRTRPLMPHPKRRDESSMAKRHETGCRSFRGNQEKEERHVVWFGGYCATLVFQVILQYIVKNFLWGWMSYSPIETCSLECKTSNNQLRPFDCKQT